MSTKAKNYQDTPNDQRALAFNANVVERGSDWIKKEIETVLPYAR